MKYNERPDVWVTPLILGDEQDLSDMVYSCLDKTITQDCEPKIVSFLKNLYRPEGILSLIMGPGSENREVYVARAGLEGKAKWAISYEKMQSAYHIGMFYGRPGLEGARAAGHLLNKVEDELRQTGGSIMTGKVLPPARKFIERYGQRSDGEIKFSEPETVEDTDPVTHKKVRINVLEFVYTPDQSIALTPSSKEETRNQNSSAPLLKQPGGNLAS